MLSRFERFSFALSELSRYWHKIAAEEMERYGLKGPHCIYLLTLYRHSEGITASRLGELCGKDKADVSRTMNLMLQKGLVLRSGASYRALLQLTDAGRAAAEQVQRKAATAAELGGKGLTDGDRQIFYQVMEQIAQNLRSICQSGLDR